MGRCNNRRTQAAAEQLKNTPSRARFSKGPPQRRKKRNNNKNNNSSNSNGNTKTGGSSGRTVHGNIATTARVIDKIASRQQQQKPQERVATREEALKYANKSEYDEIILPKDILDLINNLLESLGVKESKDGKTKQNEARNNDNLDEDDSIEDQRSPLEGASSSLLSASAVTFIPKNENVSYSGYSEYDDDVNEEENETEGERLQMATGLADIREDMDWEGGVDEDDRSSLASQDNENGNSDIIPDQIKTNADFIHLTQRYSFSEQQASRACLAIEEWDVQDDGATGKAGNETKHLKKSDETFALALDWLCLHLTEAELTQGLKPNKTENPKEKISIHSKNTNIKVIPHPSISVAKSLTSDKEWSRSIRIQEEILTFVKMGFYHSEASQVCENNTLDYGTNARNDAMIFELLTILESKACDDRSPSTDTLHKTDMEYAAEERSQEIEVLRAIYDEQLEIVASPDNIGLGKEISRYTINITPAEDLQEPARSEDCKLQVFPRPGYPVLEPPQLLFSNPSLPPSLLRRINDEIARQAVQNIGSPVVFEIVNFLSESIHLMQIAFIKEQRRKEFEAEQLRIRKQGHGIVAQASEVEVDVDGKLGRRQLAKLRAAEKAYNREDQIKKENEEFRQRQEERIQGVKEQNKSVRTSMVERTLAKRERERIEEEAERAARAAMNAAFLRGDSVEEARRVANEARTDSLKINGVDESSSAGEKEPPATEESEKNEETHDLAQDVKESNPTPTTAAFMDRLAEVRNEKRKDETTATTSAFMDRLRQMYEDAAKQKAGTLESGVKGDEGNHKKDNHNKQNELDRYHLSQPVREDQEEIDEDSDRRIPCPVSIPNGELGDLMNDIIDQQKDQPWLVSQEARAPTISLERKGVSTEQTQRQQEISENLRLELQRKRKSAADWAKKHSVSNAQRGKKTNGFSPQRFHSMMSVRERLPAYAMEDEVVSTIKLNQITVIAGDTGCGKTTQVPQLILDDLILNGEGASTNIIVTQPRRISAIGVSERIADERCEKVGETCGYSIKLEKKMSSRTRLLLCTTGILLRRLQCDPDLANVSHIFVDEVHERDLNTDFLIIILKDLLARRKDLKLVLMSATLNSAAFSTYFGNCPVVSIPGRAHPVKEHRLEDILGFTGHQVQEGSDYALPVSDSKPPPISKSALRKLYHPKYCKETINSLSIIDEEMINYPLIADLLEYISLTQDKGAILVFMPGMMEITKTIEELYKKEFFQSSKVVVYPLHSSLTTAEQKAIFEVPPEGVRKIVVSTNIAETSITIEDVVYVVDSGRVKENRRDEINETPTLVECWVSRASAKQRRGRAGRVRPGIAYHLYSSHTHEKHLQDYQLPEMLRVGIEDLVLQILILDLGEPTSFLSKALNPPSDLAMSNSLKLLETLGAVECQWQNQKDSTAGKDGANEDSQKTTSGTLEVSSELTALGFHLATLPVDPRVGKMMIYGSLFGCLDPCLTVAASMSARSPFLSPFDQRDEADAARKKFAVDYSDHLTILNAFNMWKDVFQTEGHRAVKTFLKDNFLGRLTLNQMEELRKQFAGLLKDIGFLPKNFQLKNLKTFENENSTNTGLIKAVLCAGLYPNIIVAPRDLTRSEKSKKTAGEHAFRSHGKGEVYLHPSSISFTESRLDSRYCCFHEIVKTSKIYVRDCTTVSPFALLLFGGKLDVFQTHGICSVDGWLKFRIDAKPATLVKYLRSQMERILLRKIVSPEEDVVNSEEGKALIQSISILFRRATEEQAPIPDDGREIVRPWTGNDENQSTGRQGGRGGRGRSKGGRNNGRGFGRGSGRGQARGARGRGR